MGMQMEPSSIHSTNCTALALSYSLAACANNSQTCVSECLNLKLDSKNKINSEDIKLNMPTATSQTLQ
jgi:hypothetical protein